MLTSDSNYILEEAVRFLVRAVEKSGHNPKPVILHSLEVGLYLHRLNYPDHVVIAALLHDILEDTDVSVEILEEKFGAKVARLVKSLSFDPSIADRNVRGRKEMDQCVSAGREAMIIKATDLLQNSDYLHFASDVETKDYVLRKIKYFLEKSRPAMAEERAWIELNRRYKKLVRDQTGF